MHVCSIDDLNNYLSSHPLTKICQTKYGKLKQKYEYRFCQCGCSYQISIQYSSDGLTCHVTEGAIPPDHFDVEENPDNCDKDNEVAKVIDALIDEHQFTNNHRPQCIISEL
jgi:hypothetical protein